MNLSPEQAKAMADMMAHGIEMESQTTRKVLAAIPEDKLDFKLGEKGWSTAKIAWHIARSEAWFAAGICAGEFGMDNEPEPSGTVADLLAWYDANVPAGLAQVKQLSAEKLAQPINFYNMFNMPAVMYMEFWKNHSIHHRGYLAAYLRAMNARVPAIYGGSADEPLQMPETAAAGA